GLAFTPDGTRLASTGRDGQVKLWDPRAAAEVLSLRGQAAFDTVLAFSPDGEHLVAGGWEGFMRDWSVQDPRKDAAKARRAGRPAGPRRQGAAGPRSRHWFGARHHLNTLVKLEPDGWQHRADLGRANAELGAWDEAAADFEAALAVPGCPLA